MLAGSILTLNFYSYRIDVLIGEDNTVYINWNDYKSMLDISHDLPHNLIGLGGDDEPYVALSYLVNADLFKDAEPNLAELVRAEFFGYIVKELSVIRSYLPAIHVSYDEWQSGIFEHNDRVYFTDAAVATLLGITRATLPVDVPKYPALITVAPSTFRYSSWDAPTHFPVWMMEIYSLPYVLKKAREEHQDRSPFLTLGPAQRFNSPGIVGEHTCVMDEPGVRAQSTLNQVDSDTTMKVIKLDEPLSWPQPSIHKEL